MIGGPALVGSLELSCRYNIFVSCLGCSSEPSTKYYFPHRTLFHFLSPHCSATWTGRRAGSPVSVSLVSAHVSDPGIVPLRKGNMGQQFCPSLAKSRRQPDLEIKTKI
jgi:hypothetical protein